MWKLFLRGFLVSRHVLRETIKFQSLMEVFGPSLFTKGLLKYKREKFKEAQKLILKAGRWMPNLKEDNFYRAALLLVESNLNENFSKSRFREAFESLADSPYANTDVFCNCCKRFKAPNK
jgi:hypothetical protein